MTSSTMAIFSKGLDTDYFAILRELPIYSALMVNIDSDVFFITGNIEDRLSLTANHPDFTIKRHPLLSCMQLTQLFFVVQSYFTASAAPDLAN